MSQHFLRPRGAALTSRRVMAGAAVVLTLTACGGTSTGSPATGSRTASQSPQSNVIAPARDFGDACRLLSAADVQAAVGGGPITATAQNSSQQGSFCLYTQPPSGSTPVLTLQVMVQPTASDARAGVDQLGGSPLNGIGDAARLATPAGLGTQVDVARGATLAALLTVKNLPQQALVQLARLVADRL
jgi:hypothetical protein